MVGEGNPATAMAIARKLRSNQLPAELSFLTISGFPANLWHKRMTQSEGKSAAYTVSSEQRRKGPLAQVFGNLSKLEMDISLREFFDFNPSPVMIGVQELQFLAFTAPQLLARFYQTFLYIPDVFPKASAVEILQRLPITALVWNAEAREDLEKKGIAVKLVEPVLPYAFADAFPTTSPSDPYVLIKSSGSGMPRKLAEALTTFYREKKIPFQLWLPDRVELLEESRPLPIARQERTMAFYHNLLNCPPQAVIAYPSEMVQVLYALAVHGQRIPYLSLPPRGAHELANLNWGMKKGVISAEWKGKETLSRFQDTLSGNDRKPVVLPQTHAVSLREVIARARS